MMEPVGQAMEPHGVQTGIGEHYLQRVLCGGIALEDHLKVFAYHLKRS